MITNDVGNHWATPEASRFGKNGITGEIYRIGKKPDLFNMSMFFDFIDIYLSCVDTKDTCSLCLRNEIQYQSFPLNAHVTVGEISHTLRKVWCEYHQAVTV